MCTLIILASKGQRLKVQSLLSWCSYRLPSWFCIQLFLHCFSMVPSCIPGWSHSYVFYSWHWPRGDHWFCSVGYTSRLSSCPADIVWGPQPRRSSQHPWAARSSLSHRHRPAWYSLPNFTTALALPFLLIFLFYGGVVSESRRGRHKDLCSAISNIKSLLLTFLNNLWYGLFTQLSRL